MDLRSERWLETLRNRPAARHTHSLCSKPSILEFSPAAGALRPVASPTSPA